MDEKTRNVLEAAHAALRRATRDLPPGALTAPTPCTEWTVAQVVEHAVLDQGIWASCVGGAEPPEGDAFAPSGTLPADVAGLVDEALAKAAAAWSGLPADARDVASPLPQGRLDVGTAARAAALDAAVHAWDIAVAVGAGPVLDDELAAEITPAAHELVEPLRAWGAYAAAGRPVPGDGAAAALLRYLGRDPEWAATR
jgi:uncharacterized protein (TIGR03086 family)